MNLIASSLERSKIYSLSSHFSPSQWALHSDTSTYKVYVCVCVFVRDIGADDDYDNTHTAQYSRYTKRRISLIGARVLALLSLGSSWIWSDLWSSSTSALLVPQLIHKPGPEQYLVVYIIVVRRSSFYQSIDAVVALQKSRKISHACEELLLLGSSENSCSDSHTIMSRRLPKHCRHCPGQL